MWRILGSNLEPPDGKSGCHEPAKLILKGFIKISENKKASPVGLIRLDVEDTGFEPANLPMEDRDAMNRPN